MVIYLRFLPLIATATGGPSVRHATLSNGTYERRAKSEKRYWWFRIRLPATDARVGGLYPPGGKAGQEAGIVTVLAEW